MKVLAAVAMLLALSGTTGCGQAVKRAQFAYDRASASQRDVRAALFTKAWGMTRIAGAEANAKSLAEAKVVLLRAQLNKDFGLEKAEQILDQLASEIAKHEPFVSDSFARLSFLLQQGELADAMMGNVDFYLESQRSWASQLTDQAPGVADDVEKAWISVEGLLKPIVDRFKDKPVPGSGADGDDLLEWPESGDE